MLVTHKFDEKTFVTYDGQQFVFIRLIEESIVQFAIAAEYVPFLTKIMEEYKHAG